MRTSSPPHHQRVGLSRSARCQSWGPIKKKNEAQLAGKDPSSHLRKQQPHSPRQRDNQPCVARGEVAVTRRTKMRPVLHTDERFHRHQT